MQFAEVKKSHAIFDVEIKSLRTNHALHLGKFDIVDKHFLQLEKDLKKYASQIYEYGSSFSILSNGALIGMTNGLNLVAGTGMTISVSANSSGAITATFNSSGGGGGAPTIPTGTVNGINLTFTATTKPSIVFTEGGTFTNGFGVTITGSGSSFTIVFAAGLAPQQWIYYL